VQAGDISDVDGAKLIQSHVLLFLDLWFALQDKSFLADPTVSDLFCRLAHEALKTGVIERHLSEQTTPFANLAAMIKVKLPEEVCQRYRSVLEQLALSSAEAVMRAENVTHKLQVHKN